MTFRKLIPILVATIALFCMAIPSAHACRRVVVRQGDDLVKVFSGTHTKYVIKDNIDLKGKKVKIGEGCTLVFQGGSLSNGTIVGNNTCVKAENYEIFKRGYVRYRAYVEAEAKRNSPPSVIKERHNCIVIEGTWNNYKCGFNWTGLQNNSREDAMLAIQNYVTLHRPGAKVAFPKISVLGYERAVIQGDHVIDFNNSTISYPDNLSIWEDKNISLPKSATPCPLESGYGLITIKSNSTIRNINIDGKSTHRQNEPVRLGVSCVVAVGNAQNVTFENVVIANVLGPAVTAQSGAKDILYINCRFNNIGEHVVYSHQYRGFCHFENCTFDTWDSKRVSEYRDGLDYLYKYVPHYENGEATYDELYRFDLRFTGCTFNNPYRVNSQGRTLGAFFTGTFPVVINLINSKFIGAFPAVNPGGGCEITEKVGKPYRMVVRGCNGAPYIYSSKSNSNIITEFYDCVNIPFRTVYAKSYERCKLYLDVYEGNIENVTPAFKKEFAEPLIIKDCEFIDNGGGVKINHPVFHRPVFFENCIFTSTINRDEVANLVTVKSDASIKITFKSCDIYMSGYRLIGGKYKKNDVEISNCEIKIN